MVNPRNSAIDEPPSRTEPVLQLPQEKNWLAKLQNREPFLYWEQFQAQIVHDNTEP
jgi:hypothetical protein